ncbi:MAG: hypothetical protein IMX03_04530 [Brockia lithotrophica]|nr:hypothetical protein [Brockia lithotrophica]
MTDESTGGFRERGFRPSRPQVVVETGRSRRGGDSPGTSAPPRPWIRQGAGAAETTSVFRRLYGKERPRDGRPSPAPREGDAGPGERLSQEGGEDRADGVRLQGERMPSSSAGGVLVTVPSGDLAPEETWFVGLSEGGEGNARGLLPREKEFSQGEPRGFVGRGRREVPLESPRAYVLTPSPFRRRRSEVLAWIWTILAAVVLGLFLGYVVLWLMAHSDLHRLPEDAASPRASSPTVPGTVHLAPQRFYLLQVGAYQDAAKAEAAASEVKAKGVTPVAAAEDVHRLFAGLAVREADARLLARAYDDLGVEVYVKAYTVPEQDVNLSASDAETSQALGDFLTAFTFLVEKTSMWTASGVEGPVVIDEEAWQEFREAADRFRVRGETLEKRLNGASASAMAGMRTHLDAAVAGMVKYVEKPDKDRLQTSQGELVRAFLAYREFLAALAQTNP